LSTGPFTIEWTAKTGRVHLDVHIWCTSGEDIVPAGQGRGYAGGVVG
jgi:hypothetical protein